MAHPQRPSDPQINRQFLAHGGVGAWSDEGEGPAVVLVHGLPGTGRDFRWLAPALTPHLRVIRVDLPGFGLAPPGAFALGIDGLGAYVLDVLEALEVPRAVVLGHSFGSGGALAAADADTAGRVAGVALVAPLGGRPHRGFRRVPRPDLWRRLVEARGVGHLARPAMRALFDATGFGRVSDRDVQRTFAVMETVDFGALRALAARIIQPTFGAWSVDDTLIEAEICEAQLDRLPAGPRLRFETGGHALQKTRACEIAEALVPWVHRVAGARSGG